MRKDIEERVLNEYLKWKRRLEAKTGLYGLIGDAVRRYEIRTDRYIKKALSDT